MIFIVALTFVILSVSLLAAETHEWFQRSLTVDEWMEYFGGDESQLSRYGLKEEDTATTVSFSIRDILLLLDCVPVPELERAPRT